MKKSKFLLFVFIYFFIGFVFPSGFLFCNNVPDQNGKEVFVKTNNAKLFCRVLGKGNPIIVIHGGPGLSQDYLLPQMASLKEKSLVVFYDQRGCGRSTGKINAHTIQIKTFIEDLEAIRKFFDFKKVTILGHSWGGFLALEYVITHPEVVDKLILLNTSPASSEDFSLGMKEIDKRLSSSQKELQALQKSVGFSKKDTATVEKYFQIMFEKYFFDPKKVCLLHLSMTPKAARNGFKVSEIFGQNFYKKPFNLYPELEKLQIPTLIIHGDFDPVPLSSAKKLHKSIKGSKFILIKNCGHFPYIEKPIELFKNIDDFLNSCQSPD